MLKRLLAIIALLQFSTPVSAAMTTLLNLVDTLAVDSPYSLAFTASGTTTRLSVAGYNVPGITKVSDNSVTLSGGSINLLGPDWIYTPAPQNPAAFQFTSDLYFAGTTIGSYDIFSQDFATTAGNIYVYSFLLDNLGPDRTGFRVTVDSSIAPSVPETPVWTMLIMGFGAVGSVARSRPKQAHSGGAFTAS